MLAKHNSGRNITQETARIPSLKQWLPAILELTRTHRAVGGNVPRQGAGTQPQPLSKPLISLRPRAREDRKGGFLQGAAFLITSREDMNFNRKLLLMCFIKKRPSFTEKSIRKTKLNDDITHDVSLFVSRILSPARGHPTFTSPHSPDSAWFIPSSSGSSQSSKIHCESHLNFKIVQ